MCARSARAHVRAPTHLDLNKHGLGASLAQHQVEGSPCLAVGIRPLHVRTAAVFVAHQLKCEPMYMASTVNLQRQTWYSVKVLSVYGCKKKKTRTPKGVQKPWCKLLTPQTDSLVVCGIVLGWHADLGCD